MNGFPIQTIYGLINNKNDCPHFSLRSGTCDDLLYKKCSLKRCNRLHGTKKSKR